MARGTAAIATPSRSAMFQEDGVTLSRPWKEFQDQLASVAAAAITALTGDVTASGPGGVLATLAASGVTPGTYGDSTHVTQITVDAKGRVTVAVAVAIAPLVGDVTTAAVSGVVTSTLAASGVTAGTYGDATHVAHLTIDAKGRVTAASLVAITAGLLPANNLSDVANNATARGNLSAAVKTGVTAHGIVLAKLSSGGAAGSLSWNSDGTITAYADPT